MNEAEFEIVHRSRKAFRDFGDPYVGLKQVRAVLAAWTISVLEKYSLTTRKAAHTDLSLKGYPLRMRGFSDREGLPFWYHAH